MPITIDKNEILDYIKSLRKNYIENYTTENGVVLDLYYPSRKFGFRLSGFQWNPNDNPKKALTQCMKEGIRVIHIYDYEWYNCKENFKRWLKSFVDSRNKKMIRSTDVIEIKAKEFSEFLKDNHLFSDTIKGCTVMYGIYENDELVSVAGFNKRNSKTCDWEWRRFSIAYGWMSEHNLAKLFLNKFIEDGHKGGLIDYQQLDRFPFTTDAEMGFVKKSTNSGVVSINDETMNYTRHSFIPEKDMTKQETMEYYGFTHECKNCGTVTWFMTIE